MSEPRSVTLSEAVYTVWSILREQGFDAAQARAVEFANGGVTPQIHADLCAIAGRFEQAYHSASLANGEMVSGGRYARLALFADALGAPDVAKHHSTLAVAAQPETATLEWIVWLINRCGAHSAAAHMLRAYTRHAPRDAHGYWFLAVALTSLPGEEPEAERREALAQAYSLDPAIHEALPLQLALAYRGIQDWNGVERVSRDALAKNPADTEMAWQLSHAQWQRNDAAAAEATMRAVDAVAPGNAAVIAAVGHYLNEQARYDEAEATLHAALAIDPATTQAAMDLADLELRRNEWSKGWRRFEARLARDDREANNVISVMARLCPRWRGEPLAGKTLMVHSEQGNGDDIQMVRFLPELAARVHDEGGRLVVAVRRALQPLVARFYADCVSIEDGPLGKPDFGLPMMSMPLTIDLHPEQVHGTPYLHADAQRIEAWRLKVRAAGQDADALHVGLVWRGSPTHRRDAKRSIPLAELAPVFALPDVVFHPLTPGLRADVALLNAIGVRVRDLTTQYEAGFDDVAAHVSALDALLTIDSAPLHLGGALGRPVLALLDHVSHWSWGTQEQHPWYDSVELYRQPQPGIWSPVVERAVARLVGMRVGR